MAADLENGFGHAPETVAETIRLAADTGLAGGSIEDATGEDDAPIYDFAHAVERVTAAAEAARRLHFVLTARAENFLHGKPDLDDTVRRLQAYEQAGADVLFAPGSARPGRGAHRVQRAQEAREFHGRHARQVVRAGGPGGRRGEARQPLDHAVPRGHDAGWRARRARR